MGVSVTIARANKVDGFFVPDTTDEPSQTVSMKRDEALSLFASLVWDLGSNIDLVIVELSETSISFYHEDRFDPFDGRFTHSWDTGSVDVMPWYGFLYSFEMEKDAQLNDWDVFLTIAYPFVVFHDRLCAPSVLEFVQQKQAARTDVRTSA